MPTPQDRFKDRLASVAREPLVHFLLLGTAIYLLYGLAGPDVDVAGDESRKITVTASEIGWLSASWQKRWNRPPTADERAGLISEYVRETVLYREALAMGLDKDDTIIRRRLAQKLEFLSQDLVAAVPPAEEDLIAYFAEHLDRYRLPSLTTFTSVFVDPDLRGDETLADSEVLGAQLRALQPPTEGAAELGDPFMLQAYYPDRSEVEIAKLFGTEFARNVASQEPGHWQGPVLSGYGVHWVYVGHRIESETPQFEQVREKVTTDWQDQRRRDFDVEFYASLRDRYEVVIEEAEEETTESADVAGDELAARRGEAR